MHLSGLDLLFWVASFVGHVALVFVLIYRKRTGTHPFFTALIVSSVLRTVTLYTISINGSKAEYFYAYWSLAQVDMLLQLAVVYEVASDIFRFSGLLSLARRPRVAFVIAFCLLADGVLTWLSSPPTRLWMQTAMIKGSFFSAALNSEFFAAIIILSVTAGLPWGTHSARIIQGLGLYSLIDVGLEAGHGYFGMTRDTRIYVGLSQLRISMYLACLVYWIIMFWRDQPVPRVLTEKMRSDLLEIGRRVKDDLKELGCGSER